jgi:hypothetical protein
MRHAPGDSTSRAFDSAQRTAAKAAGFLYLLLMVTGVFAELYARGDGS